MKYTCISERYIVKSIREKIGTNPIPKPVIAQIQSLVDKYLEDVIDNVIAEHKELNRLRGIQGLKEHKRLGMSEYLRMSRKIFNNPQDFKVGTLGEVNSNTNVSEKQKR